MEIGGITIYMIRDASMPTMRRMVKYALIAFLGEISFLYSFSGSAGASIGANAYEILPQLGHSSSVVEVEVSPDGKTIATLGLDRAIRLWQRSNGKELWSEIISDTRGDEIKSMRYLDPFSLIATTDRYLLSIDIQTRAKTILHDACPDRDRSLLCGFDIIHIGKILSLQQNLVLVDNGSDGISWFDISAGSQKLIITAAKRGLYGSAKRGLYGFVTSRAISKNSMSLANGLLNGDVEIWDIGRGKLEFSIGTTGERISALAYSPDGSTLAIADSVGWIYLVDARTGVTKNKWRGHLFSIADVAYSPDGHFIATASFDNSAAIWDVEVGRRLVELKGHTAQVLKIKYINNEQGVITSSSDGSIIEWSINDKDAKVLQKFRGIALAATALCISPNKKTASVGYADGSISLWDIAEGIQLRSRRVHAGEVSSLTCSSKQQIIASAGVDKTVRLLRGGSLLEYHVFRDHADRVTDVAFSSDGQMLASSGWDKAVRLHDILGKQPSVVVNRHSDRANSVVFSSNNKRLISVGNDRKLRIASIKNRREKDEYENEYFSGSSVAASSHGLMLATGWSDGTIRVIDNVLSEDSGGGLGHNGFVNTLEFSPDGTLIASGGEDGKVKIWPGLIHKDGLIQEEVASFTGHLAEVNHVTFAWDRNSVLSASNDGTVRLYDYVKKSEVAKFISMGANRWLVMTPEGFFSTNSLEAAESVNVVTGLSARSVLDFWDVFYRPDIVKAKLAGEDISILVGNLSIEKALQSPPPSVFISQMQRESTDLRIKVPYEIHAQGGGIAEVRVFHNGKLTLSDGVYKDAPGKAYTPVARKDDEAVRYAIAKRDAGAARLKEPGSSSQRTDLIVRGAPEKKCDPCRGEAEIEVIPGEENTVTVTAFNRDNTIQSAPATVRFKSMLPKQEPAVWILPVGIDRFNGVTRLKNARKDAQDFACSYAGKDAVTKLGLRCGKPGQANGLFKPDHVHVIDALFDERATKANILNALEEIAQQARPQDTFVWFVASHGMMDANSLFGIVAHDTQCLNSNCTDIQGHITSNEILEASKKIKAMKQLMVLDTCHSGGLDAKLSGLYDARISVLARNMGLHLYASAQSTEQALDGQPGTNGAFTAQLLAGIESAAPDKNNDGHISIVELGDFARERTIVVSRPKEGAKGGKGLQNPVIQHFGKDAALVRLRKVYTNSQRGLGQHEQAARHQE